MGLLRSATWSVGCPAPLGTYGCAGSDITGPGPLSGGRKSSPVGRSGNQPTVGSGVKFGAALCPVAAGASAAYAAIAISRLASFVRMYSLLIRTPAGLPL